MNTPQMNYFLNANGLSIPVGTTKPRYDRQKGGWVTDAGIFSTKNPGDYIVSGTTDPVTEAAIVAAPVAPVVTPTA